MHAYVTVSLCLDLDNDTLSIYYLFVLLKEESLEIKKKALGDLINSKIYVDGKA